MEVWIEILTRWHTANVQQSLPAREVWIEITMIRLTAQKRVVTSRKGSVD